MKVSMPTRMVVMTKEGTDIADVPVILNIKDFTLYASIFWRFQVRGSWIIGQICIAESKNFGVPGKMVSRAVPHREINVVIGSFLSSHS